MPVGPSGGPCVATFPDLASLREHEASPHLHLTGIPGVLRPYLDCPWCGTEVELRLTYSEKERQNAGEDVPLRVEDYPEYVNCILEHLMAHARNNP